MTAQPQQEPQPEVPSYDDWLETQCHIGYDPDEDWIAETADHLLDKLSVKAGIKDCLYRNKRGEFNWHIGMYSTNDYVTFDVCVDLDSVPKDHPLRADHPFAFVAHDKQITYDHEVSFLRGYAARSHGSFEFQWTADMPNQYSAGYGYDDDDDTPLNIGSVYDGMPCGEFAEIVDDQTDSLMDTLRGIVVEAASETASALREDYDYFFSEERYEYERDEEVI